MKVSLIRFFFLITGVKVAYQCRCDNPVKLQRYRHKTEGGVAYTRYLVSIYFSRNND